MPKSPSLAIVSRALGLHDALVSAKPAETLLAVTELRTAIDDLERRYPQEFGVAATAAETGLHQPIRQETR